MPLKVQLTEDMKQAMRDRNSDKLSAIRYLLSEIKNYEIDNGAQDDDGIINIISRQIKQMKDAQNDFKNAGREDLVADEEKKINVMLAYMPAQMDEASVKQIIAEVMASQESPNMGSVMKVVKEKVGNQADGAMVARLVKESLA